MQEALVRLGLSNIATFKFINNGVINTAKLCVLSQDDLDRLIKQIQRDNQGAGLFIPFMSQQYIHAVRFWANRMYILGAPHGADLVNEKMADQWSEIMKEEAEAAKAPTDLLKLPEPFKKDAKWCAWKESITTYLNSKTGQASIPLAYIIREHDDPIPNLIYATVHGQLVSCAILHGTKYNRNNGIVYDLLQSLMLNGPAWAWINGYQSSRDGRRAQKALVTYYEGDSMSTKVICSPWICVDETMCAW
jgi:hypothetical protein